MNQPTPKDYIDAGFRILRCHPENKTPLAGGFGAADPDFSCRADEFRPTERVAILLGSCPRVWDDSQGEDLLLCLDLDHGLTVEEVEEQLGPLPDTLTSKNGAHMYYRVAPSAARDQLRQWTNALRAEDTSLGALDLKWHGGYAIEPGNVPGGWDDGGFDPDRIAAIPDAAIQALVALNHRPSAPRDAVATGTEERYPYDAEYALRALWPRETGKGFDCALALGGVLAQSDLTDDAALELALTVVGESRIRQVEVSLRNLRDGTGVEVKGWPTFLSLINDDPEALERFTEAVPGLRRGPSPDAEALTALSQQMQADPEFLRSPEEPIDPEGLELTAPDAVTIVRALRVRKCPGAVFAEGEVWCHPEENDPAALWTIISRAEVSRWVQEYAGQPAGYTKNGAAIPLRVGSQLVASVYSCLCDAIEEADFFEGTPAQIVFRNGLLEVGTKRFRPATPEDRVRSVLPFDYSPTALEQSPPVAWAEFVSGQWGSDDDSIALLHQILGYILSGRQDLEKMFVLLGPPRSGKGTIIKLLQSIMGDACGTFKIADLDKTFGMSAMVGKSLLVDPDVRASKSQFKDSGMIAERLLSTTSAEQQAIRRMHKEPINMTLPGRLLVAANPPFHLADEGGALSSRLVILKFKTGHIGSEDRGLLERLKAETPGIVALALAGLEDLEARGDFSSPSAAAAARNEIRLSQNPLIEWWEDHCSLAPTTDLSAPTCDEVFAHLLRWREAEGLRPMSKRALSGFLSQYDISSKVVRRGEKTLRVYVGMKLKD